MIKKAFKYIFMGVLGMSTVSCQTTTNEKPLGVDLAFFSAGTTARPIVVTENPANLLRTASGSVDAFSTEALEIMQQLAATVLPHEAKTWGLAAPQIGINKRVLYYAEIGDDKAVKGRYFLINPSWKQTLDEMIDSVEGCFSVVGKIGIVRRYKSIHLTGTLFDGENFIEVNRVVDDKNARMLQHEIDHLDGILYTDRLTEQGREEFLYDQDYFEKEILPTLEKK